MKGIIVNGGNGKYTAEVVYDLYDANGNLDEKMIEEREILLTDDSTNKVYVVDYNGKLYYPIFFSFEEVEDEFEDCVVEALKKKGYFSSIEDDPNADDDDDEYVIKVFTLEV